MRAFAFTRAIGPAWPAIPAFMALAACDPAPPAENFAVTVMRVVEPGASCTPLYTDVGEQRVHTAVCSKLDVISLCRVGLDGLRCDPFEFGKKKE